jgi:predicted dithiol-disulfide oxidoreductase (DUF899 family)
MNLHPNASPEYQKLRGELYEAELALREQRERVAELRRSLPRDTVVEDSVFERIVDGQPSEVRLSELFEDPNKPLVIMHFMFGKAQTSPCPMCTLWADGYDGAIPHLSQRVNFVVLVAGNLVEFQDYARGRGWENLRIASAGSSTVKLELEFENEAGDQYPGVSVYERASDGSVRHFYSSRAYGPDGGRMMDLLSPVWNYFDLTPEGRGEFFPNNNYAD